VNRNGLSQPVTFVSEQPPVGIEDEVRVGDGENNGDSECRSDDCRRPMSHLLFSKFRMMRIIINLLRIRNHKEVVEKVDAVH